MGKHCGWLWSGVDWQFGDGGGNWLVGGAGRDWLFGRAGDDRLEGRDGNDWLFGEGGNDQLSGGDGHDLLHGGSGDDQLEGGRGYDWLSGGWGDDVMSYQTGDGHDVFHGGGGTDTIRLDSLADVWQLHLWRGAVLTSDATHLQLLGRGGRVHAVRRRRHRALHRRGADPRERRQPRADGGRPRHQHGL